MRHSRIVVEAGNTILVNKCESFKYSERIPFLMSLLECFKVRRNQPKADKTSSKNADNTAPVRRRTQ